MATAITFMPTNEVILWVALGIGLTYGVVAQISGFCLNSALRQQIQQGDGNKLRAFALALVVAIVGTQIAATLDVLDLSASIYLTDRFSWFLIPVGGVLFGYGMILARGCGARALVLLGQGNLRCLLVLLCLGISAFATLTGLLGPLRSAITDATSVTLASATFSHYAIRWGFVTLLCAALLYFVFRDKHFVHQRKDFFGGLLIGALVLAGWLTTGWLGFDDFDPTPLTSLTFVAPVGAAIQYSMIATGMDLNFGIVLVLGLVLGSLLAARLTGRFQWVGFDLENTMPRYIAGGVMMGVGGALAMGCSIGQGLTGMSTLSFVSMIAFAGILLGACLALFLERSGMASAKPIYREQ